MIASDTAHIALYNLLAEYSVDSELPFINSSSTLDFLNNTPKIMLNVINAPYMTG